MTKSNERVYLSEEELDLKNMTIEERLEHYTFWLQLAQATNDKDKALYSHGVFSEEPQPGGMGVSTGDESSLSQAGRRKVIK